MLVRVLGPVDVVGDDGSNVGLGGVIPSRLLVLLVVAGGEPVAINDLIVDLWPSEERPENPVGSLRTYVARLRSILGSDALLTGTGSYRLGEVQTDATHFEELVERARRASGSPTAGGVWGDAVGLWRGPAFGDHGDLDSVRTEANRLEELRAEATEAWFDARLAAGEARELSADVETAVAEFPLREGFRAQQMTVLARAGRQAEALRAFQEFRGDLTEIGLEPSEYLAELEGQIAGGELPTTGARRTLRGYELGGRLGEGAFAIVHSATQASVGREVAIKQIRQDLADQPEFIRQFEAEAHLVARLEHPHIVPLYDYWREPGSAFLVMRLLEGGSLGSRIIDKPFEITDLAPMVGQISAGLDEAHRAGVIHRDVKPANILLDTTGNAYLSDFGIAIEEQERLDPEAWLSNGSPAYAPPEQLRREVVGRAADVYALGVTVYEALTGQLPFPAETTMAGLLLRQLNDPIPLVRSSHPSVPAAVDAVIQKATAKEPNERHATAGEFANDLAIAAGLEGDGELITVEDRNPYKGLAAFDEADASDFSGRDRLVTQLVDAVAAQRAVMVVGPSGSGKSSVVRAGVLPALRSGAVEGSERWFITTMIPGASPFADLAEAMLRVAVDPPPDLSAELAADVNGITRMARRLVPEGRELVLVVDQFEELFTLTSETDRQAFLDGLVAAITDADTPLRLVATLRADFYDQPLWHPAFAQLVRPATVPVHPLAADELERAITEPARAVGASFEPGLVAEITAGVADQPGALPLLQYALTELYDRRADDTLTRASYKELGGVSGALARRAEGLYDSSTIGQQEATRRLFGRLVSLGEGTEDTRRRVLRRELADDPATDAALDAFGRARLLAFDRDPATREPTVEVAHEALIREWPRLRGWLDDDRANLRILRHVTETSTNWNNGGREPGELYRAGRLEAAEEWSADHLPELNQTETDFLTASIDQRTAEANAEQKTNRRLRRLLAGVAVVAVVALGAGFLAFQQQGEAQASAATAETERIAAEAVSRVDDNPQLALLLAAEAHNRDPGPTGLGALQQTLTQTNNFLGLVGADRSYSYLEWLDNNRFVAAGGSGIDIYEYPSGERLLEIDLPVMEMWADLNNDGSRRLWPVADFNHTVAVVFPADDSCCPAFVNLESGQITTTDIEIARDPAVQYGQIAIDLHPVEPLAVVLDLAGALRLFDTSTGELIWEVMAYPEQVQADFDLPEEYDATHIFPGSVFNVSWAPAVTSRLAFFSPDGAEIITASNATRRWSVTDGSVAGPESIRMCWRPVGTDATGRCVTEGGTGEAVLLLTPHAAAFDEDDELIEAGITAVLVDGVLVEVPTTGALYGLPKILTLEAYDDDTLFTQFTDRRVALINDTTAEILLEFPIPLSEPGTAGLSPNRRMIAVPSKKGVGLWSLTGAQLLASSFPRADASTASVSRTGGTITGADSAFYFLEWYDTAPFWIDTKSGQTTKFELAGPEQLVEFHAGSDSLLMTYGFDGSGRAYDAATLDLLGDFEKLGYTGAANSNSDELVAIGARGGLFIHATTGEIVTVLETQAAVASIDFNTDDSLLVAVSGEDDFFQIWDTESWEVVNDGSELMSPVQAVRYSPDGQFLVTVELEGDIVIRDAVSLEVVQRLGGSREHTFLNAVMAFSDDGRYLVVGGGDSVRLFDLEGSAQVGGTFPNDPDFRYGVNDGPRLVTAVGDHMLLWNLNLDEWVDIACRAAGRNMTRDEWEQFGPKDQAYRATCPQWPAQS